MADRYELDDEGGLVRVEVSVDLPEPTATDGDSHVWRIGPENDPTHEVESYVDRLGRPVVQCRNRDVGLRFGPAVARALAAALLSAADRAEQAADQHAQAKQDAEDGA